MSIVIAIGLCFSISLGIIKRDRMMVMTFMMIHGDMPVFPFWFLIVVVYGIVRHLIGSINAAMSIMMMTRKKLMRTELLTRNAI